ncbi:MAG: hypothetical protein ACE5HE_13200, partial [Phycisphaerae bacterium]
MAVDADAGGQSTSTTRSKARSRRRRKKGPGSKTQAGEGGSDHQATAARTETKTKPAAKRTKATQLDVVDVARPATGLDQTPRADARARSSKSAEEAGTTGKQQAGSPGRRAVGAKPKQTSRAQRSKSQRGKAGRSAGDVAPTAETSDGTTKPVEAAKTPATSYGREMVINVSAHHECRIAILENRRLEDLFIERASTQSHVGNIYKG